MAVCEVLSILLVAVAETQFSFYASCGIRVSLRREILQLRELYQLGPLNMELYCSSVDS